MPSRARTRVIGFLLAAAAALLGCQSSTSSTRPAASGALPASALPLPAQVGLPVAATVALVPGDNPQTAEKVALGRRLFFERRLSADGTVACASCHDPGRAFTDGRAASVGIKGRLGERNAQTILNALYNKTMFWDGIRGQEIHSPITAIPWSRQRIAGGLPSPPPALRPAASAGGPPLPRCGRGRVSGDCRSIPPEVYLSG